MIATLYIGRVFRPGGALVPGRISYALIVRKSDEDFDGTSVLRDEFDGKGPHKSTPTKWMTYARNAGINAPTVGGTVLRWVDATKGSLDGDGAFFEWRWTES